MSDPRCANCTYETDEVNEIGYCQTCEQAYDSGFERAMLTMREGKR